ncbi:hypothetical protein ILYODFUR_022087 [Ilyodon furcidens]|uniref:Uncharacterized protein n=1 Tax=Ilyodon furcidens TaxID=33524 RepID=A0ABV0UK28_9TELE
MNNLFLSSFFPFPSCCQSNRKCNTKCRLTAGETWGEVECLLAYFILMASGPGKVQKSTMFNQKPFSATLVKPTSFNIKCGVQSWKTVYYFSVKLSVVSAEFASAMFPQYQIFSVAQVHFLETNTD